jgi:hypothetical protein
MLYWRSSAEWDDSWTGNQGNILQFAWKNWQKPRNPIYDSGVLTKIRTEEHAENKYRASPMQQPALERLRPILEIRAKLTITYLNLRIRRLFYGVYSWNYIASNGTITNWKWYGKKLFWYDLTYYPDMCQKELRNTTKISVTTARVWSEMSTQSLPNVKQNSTHSTAKFGGFIEEIVR